VKIIGENYIQGSEEVYKVTEGEFNGTLSPLQRNKVKKSGGDLDM
jgi:hypothetical protein